jgi:antitoxin MazE
MPIRTRLIRIGNSRGLRLPKSCIERAALRDDVEIHVEHGRLIVQSTHEVRSGWEDAARHMHTAGNDGLPDAPRPTRFDRSEWTW